MKWFWDGNSAKISRVKFIFEQIGSVPPTVDNFFFEWIALAIRMDNNFLKRISQAIRGDDNFFQTDSPSRSNGWHFFLERIAQAVQTDDNFFRRTDSPNRSNGWKFFLNGYPEPFKRIPYLFKNGKTFFKDRVLVIRGTQCQFSKNICSRKTIWDLEFSEHLLQNTLLAYLSWDFQTSKKWYTCPLFF